ncbi:extradiol ring-cleavage dioxygenase [Selaginella moellendorffii]|nr:extradiol ring-cleavage dioxygenase [Selaginella moellendorffii]|eukprot:XP_002984954.2 extradiol ring-cleavage dioxygenase [Selaginella moellendorffii]
MIPLLILILWAIAGDADPAIAPLGIRRHISSLLGGSSSGRPSSGGSNSMVMDVFYVSHGSPMLPFEEIPARDFFKGMAKLVKHKPKAILMVSGHWETRDPMVSTTARNPTIHDFYGFPRELYELKYEAPGAPDVARRAKQLLQDAGFKQAGEDPKRGLDHGAWVPLWLAFPDADIPVFQLSLQSHKDAAYHYRLGRALTPLTREGVLIIGSGTTTHNLRHMLPTVPDWGKAFDDWLYDCLIHQRYDEVTQFMDKAPYAKLNHPTPDHFLPLLVALGAAGEGATAQAIHRSWHGSFSMASYVFKPAVGAPGPQQQQQEL